MAREYRGNVRIRKLYEGPKSVNVQIGFDQALNLAIHLLNATKDKVPIDIAIHKNNENKDGIYTTITFRR